MQEGEYSLRKIAELLESGKYKKRHDIIVYLFQVWLEKIGIPKDRLIIRDFIKIKLKDGSDEELEIDIAIKKNGEFPIIFEILEPDPQWSLDKPEILRRIEFMIIKTFAYLLKPQRIFLTDGTKLFVYDEKGNLIEKIENLSTVTDEKEKEFKEMIVSFAG